MIKTMLPLSAALTALSLSSLVLQASQGSIPIVQETSTEFFTEADFDKDGRQDVVIVDKETGKYRLGYFGTNGLFNWVDCRPSGIKGISGFSIGSVLHSDVPGLAFTSPDANQLSLVEAVNPTAPPKPQVLPFSDAMGPNSVIAVDIGGAGNTPLADLYVSSIYNSPDENLKTLLRNESGTGTKISEETLPGALVRANKLVLKDGGPEVVCGLIRGEQDSKLVGEVLATGASVKVLELPGLPKDAEYAAGKLSGIEGVSFVFFQPGQPKLTVRSVSVSADGKYAFGKESTADLGQPVKYASVIRGEIFAAFGGGEKAGLFKYDAAKGAGQTATVVATNYLVNAALETPNGFVVFARPATGKFSTRYHLFTMSDKGVQAGPFGGLATLADNDNITIPDIHARIAEKTAVKAESEMQLYTNSIPGTKVSYVMVPIKGGEFLMGSPQTEQDRNADEGPQHKVKVSPFWMGRCEVTWNEYELFMYPDDERRMRATIPTDAAGDKLADAVTHPSRPYVEMSFGMGKDGFPAISMTQHAANKYCQWLSAKTGEFYRLPTEAEWEYACRAGTTTRYFFGDDDSKLGEYGWFEMNSDFKYQKVGKKKPNPWGLCDMTGNVVEWVLDQYDADFYKVSSDLLVDPWNKASKPYPHSVRGGSWDDQAKSLRSAARRGSARTWKMTDPQLPKSIWYFSDAQFVGFRIVRPLKVPSAEEMQEYWSSGVERD